ncbi:hypothetical protein C8J56DRAFT_856540 [Mycena floridula]|nr:hypothetical protein C8J56DRAFT_856540 [Mycena floridula]
MVAHNMPARHFHKRDVVAIPTGNGIDGASTIDASAAVDTLAFDAGATGKASITGVPLAASTPVFTITALTTPTDPASASDSSETAQSTSGSSSVISMGTVIGACVGALAGALFLICIGLWLYKRSAPKGRSPSSPISNRNTRGEADRARSGMENWDKLGDTWEGQYQTKEVTSPVDSVGPMEKLTMFKKSTPSIMTTYTQKTHNDVVAFNLGPHPFAQYHPNLAKELAQEEPASRAYLGQVDAGPALSWDDGGGTILALTSRSHLSGSMSPSLDIARPTPGIIPASEPHHWESAEVLHFEGQAEIVDPDDHDPFSDPSERRKSSNNPFFNAQSSTSSLTKSPKSKGKGRELTDIDPFEDDMPAVPKFRHDAGGSTSSISSNDRALQSLIAALDISSEDAEERLRVASMQPSVFSTRTTDTDIYEEDVAQAFPLPPGAQGS